LVGLYGFERRRISDEVSRPLTNRSAWTEQVAADNRFDLCYMLALCSDRAASGHIITELPTAVTRPCSEVTKLSLMSFLFFDGRC